MIVGHERNQRYLERVFAKGTLAHACLFLGPDGVGKRTAALLAGQSLLCRVTPATFGGCGRCADCRSVSELRHPDLMFLSLEHPLVAGGGEREISITSIHELNRRLALAPWVGGRKVAIIDGAERVSRDGQAALLKTLEDPPRAATFFLVAGSAGGLLPTIISRAIVLSFGLVSDAAMAPLLGATPQGERRALLRIAAGRPGVAVRLAADSAARRLASAAEREYAALLGSGLRERFAFSERASREPEELAACFASLGRMLERTLRDRRDTPPEAAALAPSLAAVLRAITLLHSVPVNRRLLADWLFTSLPRVNVPQQA